MAETEAAPGRDGSKDEWRAWARRVRAGLDLPALSERICGALRNFPPLRYASTVLTYLPMEDEIDLTALLDSNLPVRWVTTRTPETGPLTIHEMGGPLESHPFGFVQPTANAPAVAGTDVDVVLVPGLAFDLFGNRLGHGRGYYDRLLGDLRAGIVRVGIVPTALVADRLPKEEHDVSVQWIAAEEGVVGVAH